MKSLLIILAIMAGSWTALAAKKTMPSLQLGPALTAKATNSVVRFNIDNGVTRAMWQLVHSPFEARQNSPIPQVTTKNPNKIPNNYKVLSVAKMPTAHGTQVVCIIGFTDGRGTRIITEDPAAYGGNNFTADEIHEHSFSTGGARLWFIGLQDGKNPVFWPEGSPESSRSLKYPTLKQGLGLQIETGRTTTWLSAAKGTDNESDTEATKPTAAGTGNAKTMNDFFNQTLKKLPELNN